MARCHLVAHTINTFSRRFVYKTLNQAEFLISLVWFSHDIFLFSERRIRIIRRAFSIGIIFYYIQIRAKMALLDRYLPFHASHWGGGGLHGARDDSACGWCYIRKMLTLPCTQNEIIYLKLFLTVWHQPRSACQSKSNEEFPFCCRQYISRERAHSRHSTKFNDNNKSDWKRKEKLWFHS